MFLWVATTLQQWALFTGAVLAIGCVAWTLYVVPTIAGAAREEDRSLLRTMERRVATLGATSSMVLVVAWLLRGAVQLWTFRDPFVPLGEDISFLLFEMFWGTVWMAQGVIVVLLLLAHLASRPPLDGGRVPVPARVSTARWITGALSLALIASLSMSSHAMGASPRSVAVTADGLHMLAAGTWIGSLAVILAASRGSEPGLFAAQVRAFSPMAVLSVGVLTAMGGYLAWTNLDAVSDLWTRPHGRVLSVKVLVASVVLLTGWWNWRKGIPSLDRAEGASLVRRNATFELAVAMCVLLLTAILVHSANA